MKIYDSRVNLDTQITIIEEIDIINYSINFSQSFYLDKYFIKLKNNKD